MNRAAIGIIGGSGLYAFEGFEQVGTVEIDTPFGLPSDALTLGRVDGVEVVFLPRHGRGHRLAPHEINYRANLWALRRVGVRWLVSVSAVGSLREAIAPGDLVLCDQFIDRTRMRPSTFFENGIVAHVSFGDPVCPVLHQAVVEACERVGGLRFDHAGTYVCIDGPQFSTRAESQLHRAWGADVVGMTALPEARLAREAEIAYATIAMATDYDCWHETEAEVSVEAVLAVLKANVAHAQAVIRALLPLVSTLGPSPAWKALRGAIMSEISAPVRERLAPILEGVPA
jgi:5'-methylthioadenosine phosphorylase